MMSEISEYRWTPPYKTARLAIGTGRALTPLTIQRKFRQTSSEIIWTQTDDRLKGFLL